MLDDQNQRKAISCLNCALDADPTSDAIFNFGLPHQQQDRYAEDLPLAALSRA
jgi:hypothetical protein